MTLNEKRGVSGIDEDSSSDEDFGPKPVASKPTKKKIKTLEFESLYLNALPNGDMYDTSYMHRDLITHVLVTPKTNFIVTASVDGHLKFWKKVFGGIEFVKHYKCHIGKLSR